MEKKVNHKFIREMFTKTPQTTLGIKKILDLDSKKGVASVIYEAKKGILGILFNPWKGQLING